MIAFFSSWTSITWVVVIGSSLVMISWIIIYSFIPANSNFFSNTDGFIDEVTVLFSNITFWATVVFSIMVALGESELWCYLKTDPNRRLLSASVPFQVL